MVHLLYNLVQQNAAPTKLHSSAGDVEEEEWIDLATVKGYCRIVLVQEVRDEVDLNVGREGAWAEVLPGFVDARLFPTPWLNKVSSLLANCPTLAGTSWPLLLLIRSWVANPDASSPWERPSVCPQPDYPFSAFSASLCSRLASLDGHDTCAKPSAFM